MNQRKGENGQEKFYHDQILMKECFAEHEDQIVTVRIPGGHASDWATAPGSFFFFGLWLLKDTIFHERSMGKKYLWRGRSHQTRWGDRMMDLFDVALGLTGLGKQCRNGSDCHSFGDWQVWANSVDPDQTVPKWAVCPGYALFAISSEFYWHFTGWLNSHFFIF